MTRKAQKEEECFYAEEYLRRRGIAGRVSASEHPDFIVTVGNLIIGIEVVSYGDQKSRQVDAAWAALQDHADQVQERNPDIKRFGVRLHFRSYRMPPPQLFERFCERIAHILRCNADLRPRGEWRTLHISQDADPLLAKYLSRLEIHGITYFSHWQWPALMNGGVGTSDAELRAVVGRKLATYRAPPGIDSSHLVIFGRGPELTRVIAPFSTEHLEDYAELNSALSNGPFEAVAILCYRDFVWIRGKGWQPLPSAGH